MRSSSQVRDPGDQAALTRRGQAGRREISVSVADTQPGAVTVIPVFPGAVAADRHVHACVVFLIVSGD